MKHPRFIDSAIAESLSETPVVLVNGARQVGKTTLVKHLAEIGWGDERSEYRTLDDRLTRGQAERDPDGFVRSDRPLIIDEVQFAPDLLRAIKLVVDEDRRPGRFLLTGSADLFTLPIASESLAGRMAIRTLHPFSQAELAGERVNIVDRLFSDDPINGPLLPSIDAGDLFARLVIGGYPESVVRSSPRRRDDWFDSYVRILVERDIQDLSNIERLSDIPRLLRLTAARTATLTNYSEYSRTLGIPNTSLKRYLTLLRGIFLLHELPAWSTNLSKRLVRSPKLHMTDTGLAASLVGAEPDAIPPMMRGPLLETFIINEFVRHAGWSQTRVALHHFRTHTGDEVDLILEDRRGRVVAVEVKSATTLSPRDFSGIETIREATGENFVRGVVVYGGKEVRMYGEGMYAVPVERSGK